MSLVFDYINHGFALVPIPTGSKAPKTQGWNLPENAITTLAASTAITGNVGLLHLHSKPRTVAIDFDDLTVAKAMLLEQGIRVDLLLGSPMAVQISSGRENRAKLLYTVPDDVDRLTTLQVRVPNTSTMVFELRCMSSNGTTMQDVLPPSVHPDTGRPYVWAGSGNWRKIPMLPPFLLEYWLSKTTPNTTAVNSSVKGTELSRLASVDPALVMNLRSALLHMRSDSRELWIKVGMALKTLGDSGRGLWLEWSATSTSYDAPAAAKVWESLNPTGINYRFVFAEAQRVGWVNPGKNLSTHGTFSNDGSTIHTAIYPESTELATVKVPLRLPPVLKKVQPLPPNALPNALRDAALDIADRMQCPIDYIAVAMLSAAGAIVGNQIGIYPLENDVDWVVHPCLWGGIVGDPGSKKSAAIQRGVEPLSHLEEQARGAYASAYSFYKSALAQWQSAQSSRKTSAAPHLTQPPVEPKTKRYVVNDTTYQALSEILATNTKGVLALSDELTGLLQSLDAQGQEQARGFYLSGWGGSQGYSSDRVGRGSLSIPRFCLSVFGGFQPDKIRTYVQHTQHGSSKNDGLMQRFQLLVWPDPAKSFTLVDRAANKAAMGAFHTAMVQLESMANMPIAGVLAGKHGERLLHFAPPAQARFNRWLTNLELVLAGGKLDPARQSHFAKYRSLVPALALLFHLLDGGGRQVPEDCVDKAIGFADYLRSHANRIYAAGSGHDFANTRSLAQKLLDGALQNGFTNRAVTLKGWTGLKTKESVQESLDALVELGWLVENFKQGVGRPTVTYRINSGISSDLLGI